MKKQKAYAIVDKRGRVMEWNAVYEIYKSKKEALQILKNCQHFITDKSYKTATIKEIKL